jgi:hypothetical protein
MNGIGDHHVKHGKSSLERQTQCFLSYSKARSMNKNDMNKKRGYFGQANNRWAE